MRRTPRTLSRSFTPVRDLGGKASTHLVGICAAVERRGCVGDRVDVNTPQVMGGEDFAFMLEARPGAFIYIGQGDGPYVHHPEYDFNDEIIPVGCSYWAKLVETALPAG